MKMSGQKCLRKGTAIFSSGMILLKSAEAFAQEAAQQKTVEEFGNMATFMTKVMTGPVAKVFALVFLIAGIWKIVNKDYGSAIGCVLALLALIFLPQLLSIFGN
jgi:type IV secretory pathway VirB2 component (pilin)